MKERLDTDRINFLVWRYLIESNYRETATKLQKEWRKPAPHTTFDFAPHVSHHALVALINKGLIFEEFERQYTAQTQQIIGLPGGVYDAPQGVFGPLTSGSATAAADVDEEADGEGEADEVDDEPYRGDAAGETQNPKKRPGDGRLHHALLIGSPAKKLKLTNGLENGAGPNGAHGGVHGIDAGGTTPMDIDKDHHLQDANNTNNNNNNNNAYPSPLEGEQVATPPPRTDGPEQSTQVPKVLQLTTKDTTYLLMGSDGLVGQRPAEHPVVLHCEWSPTDPSLLAAAGADALARLWNVSQDPGLLNSLTNHVNGNTPHFTDMQVAAHFKKTTMTAMAWNPSGDTLAMAMEDGTVARSHRNAVGVEIVGTWSVAGSPVADFDGPWATVLKILWNPNGQSFVCISHDKQGGLLSFYNLDSSARAGWCLIQELDVSMVDARWASESEVLVCGGGALASVHVTPDGAVVESRKFELGRKMLLNHLAYDKHTGFIATSSEVDFIEVWDEAGKSQSFNAHKGIVTSIEWQPLQTPATPADERLLASSGEDGAIYMWSIHGQKKIEVKYSMRMDETVIGISMTPNGEYLAGATYNRVLIWKVGEHTFPYASWKPDPVPDRLSPKCAPSPRADDGRADGGSDEDYIECLSWNVDGQKLVYGANSRLAVIHLR